MKSKSGQTAIFIAVILLSAIIGVGLTFIVVNARDKGQARTKVPVERSEYFNKTICEGVVLKKYTRYDEDVAESFSFCLQEGQSFTFDQISDEQFNEINVGDVVRFTSTKYSSTVAYTSFTVLRPAVPR